ncbi:TIGR01459 family HAD-type hydrolase [Devosia sp. A16]|uniref:TIGR01459 family HAD-type hydrolase n=1 Tax=Devosia sp. A16 TaxID=1736675 RepID=UPI0006D7F978|nr:TIGR01459 family HAD-type hydrolase [Devosia sp. A16]
MQALAGLRGIAPRYDVVLSDIWGVVHNGIAAHPTAVEALVNYRRNGGRVVLISNAPRPHGPIIEMMDGLGVSREAYDDVVTSGDATRVVLERYRGQTVHYVGPAHDNDSLFEGLDISIGQAEDAKAVVVTDLDTDHDAPDMYNERITLWLSRNLPLIAANPDRVVEHGDQILYCGGALADLYEARGGMIVMVGKPYKPIYAEALRLAETAAGRPVDRARILAIGDSVRTDAIGAAGAGLDLLFITGSIHAAELDAFGNPDTDAIAALVAPSGANVVGFMARLAW